LKDFLRIVYEGVIDFSPNELMGALMVGLALALVCHGICVLGRKRATNPLPLLCGLIFAVSVLAMAIGFGHSRYRALGRNVAMARNRLDAGPGRDPGGLQKSAEPRGRGRGRSEPNPIGRSLLLMADTNKDGRLTPEEAAQFVLGADKDEDGSADLSEIDRAQAAIVPQPNVPQLLQLTVPPS
jgi:hypothetical protein